MSKIVAANMEHKSSLTVILYDPRWLAPEVLTRRPYDVPSDVYSFGIIMWELLTLRVPFDDKGWDLFKVRGLGLGNYGA